MGDRAGAGMPRWKTAASLDWESPHAVEAKPALLSSLVVDAEGMEDVQQGCDEGEELYKKKNKSWGQL